MAFYTVLWAFTGEGASTIDDEVFSTTVYVDVDGDPLKVETAYPSKELPGLARDSLREHLISQESHHIVAELRKGGNLDDLIREYADERIDDYHCLAVYSGLANTTARNDINRP